MKYRIVTAHSNDGEYGFVVQQYANFFRGWENTYNKVFFSIEDAQYALDNIKQPNGVVVYEREVK